VCGRRATNVKMKLHAILLKLIIVLNKITIISIYYVMYLEFLYT